GPWRHHCTSLSNRPVTGQAVDLARKHRLGTRRYKPHRVAVQQLHWEDFIPGSVAEYGPRLITREEIIAFATEFDPQPMHLDEAAAAQSMLGGLAASGWQSCCLVRRIITDGFLSRSRFLGVAGIDEVRWRAPVRPGTNLRVRATVVGKRAMA